jgi:hypothetical protein
MNINIDLTDKIREMLLTEEGSEELIPLESWAKEEKKGKKLNKPFRTSGGPKKFSVYVKNEKGNVVKVNFGDPNMEIKRDDPARRKSFRARHNCDNPGPKTKARYWSCKQWRAGKKVQGSNYFNSEEDLLNFLDESESALSEKQKKLPPEIQKKILKKKSQKPSDKKEDKKEEKSEAEAKRGLWDNIHKKRQRIKDGSGEKMRKKGDKGAPTEKQIKKAQKPSKDKK